MCVVTGQRVAAFQTKWCSQLDRDKFYHASWDLIHVYIIIYMSKEHGNLCWTPLSFLHLVGILVRIFLENYWYDWLLTRYGFRPWVIGSQGILKIIICNLKWCNPKVALSPGDKWLLLKDSLKIGHPQRKFHNIQPLMFRGYVSFREHVWVPAVG